MVILAVDNLPTELPLEASMYFGDSLLPFMESIVRFRYLHSICSFPLLAVVLFRAAGELGRAAAVREADGPAAGGVRGRYRVSGPPHAQVLLHPRPPPPPRGHVRLSPLRAYLLLNICQKERKLFIIL